MIKQPQNSTTGYLLYVETDDDFSLQYKGTTHFNDINLLLQSVDELDEIKIMGPWGSNASAKSQEYEEAIMHIKENPNHHYDNTGGNRGVTWTPINQETYNDKKQYRCPNNCGSSHFEIDAVSYGKANVNCEGTIQGFKPEEIQWEAEDRMLCSRCQWCAHVSMFVAKLVSPFQYRDQHSVTSEYPDALLSRSIWRQRVASEATILGYWEWAQEQWEKLNDTH